LIRSQRIELPLAGDLSFRCLCFIKGPLPDFANFLTFLQLVSQVCWIICSPHYECTEIFCCAYNGYDSSHLGVAFSVEKPAVLATLASCSCPVRNWSYYMSAAFEYSFCIEETSLVVLHLFIRYIFLVKTKDVMTSSFFGDKFSRFG
jgi:hypothetical protein